MLTPSSRSASCVFLVLFGLSGIGSSTWGQALPFDDPTFVATNDDSWHLLVHRMDGDQVDDVVSAGGSIGVVLLGDGDGGLLSGPAFQAGMPLSVAAGDLNEDGFGDVAYSSDLNSYFLTLSNGPGGFDPPVELAPAPFPPGPIEIRDCDSDGHLDVATEGQGWLGHGDGTFSPGSCFALSAVSGDFNGDAWPDRARPVFNPFTNTIRLRVALGVSAGQFGPESDGPLFPPQTYFPFVGDADGDGLDDLVVVQNGAPRQIGIARATGSGGFADTIFTAFPDGPGQGAATDIDGDGRTEFVFSSTLGPRAHFFRGAETGGLTEYATLDLPATSHSLVLADLARDGAPEMVINNSPSAGLWVYPNRRGFLIDVPTLDPRSLALLGLLVAAAGCLLLRRARP